MNSFIDAWKHAAAMNRQYAELAKCDEARDDHLWWANFFEMEADYAYALQRSRIDYSAITRDVALS